MGEITLTKTRIASGRWEGILSAKADAPAPVLSLTCDGATVAGLTLAASESAGTWTVAVPIATEMISDGVSVFIITETASGETLATFSVAAGDALTDDLRAEVELLRAELDMLKRAFRRHCVETAGK